MAATTSPRVVSLLSSATEILHALGGLSHLVGRSHECDFPPQILQIPQCTWPLVDVAADSRSIDEQVKHFARNALSIYQVSNDLLEQLQPTHILTQVQCNVCAVSFADVQQSIASQLKSQPEIVSLNPAGLQEIWLDFHRIGNALGLDSASCINRLQSDMESLRRPPSGLSVACVEWIEPLMAAGNWTPELIELAGARNLFGIAGQHSPWVTWEELVAACPDVTIIAPCGFSLGRTVEELHWLTSRPDFCKLRRVYIADGNAWFHRPGPRIVETVEILNEMLYSSGSTFRGRAWEQLQ